jgi:hypothetical protein
MAFGILSKCNFRQSFCAVNWLKWELLFSSLRSNSKKMRLHELKFLVWFQNGLNIKSWQTLISPLKINYKSFVLPEYIRNVELPSVPDSTLSECFSGWGRKSIRPELKCKTPEIRNKKKMVKILSWDNNENVFGFLHLKCPSPTTTQKSENDIPLHIIIIYCIIKTGTTPFKLYDKWQKEYWIGGLKQKIRYPSRSTLIFKDLTF